MKPILLIVILFNLLYAGCSDEDTPNKNIVNFTAEPISINVQGLHCDGCVNAVTETLKKIDGVDIVEIDLKEKTATIIPRQDSYPDFQKIKDDLQKIGYEVEFIEI